MKNIIGGLGFCTLITGFLFKINGPFVTCDLQIILALGLLLPIYFFLNFLSEWKQGENKALIILYFLGTYFLLNGLLFKLMHWPFGDILLIITLGVLFPLYYLVKGLTQIKTNQLQILFGLFFSLFIWSQLFSFLHLLPSDILIMENLGYLGLMVSVILTIISFNKGKSNLLELNAVKSIIMFSTIIILFMYFIETRKVPVKNLLKQMNAIHMLQDKNQFEKIIGDSYSQSIQSESSKKIDKKTAGLIWEIEALKFSMFSMTNSTIDNSMGATLSPKKDSIILMEINLFYINSAFNQKISNKMITSSQGVKLWSSLAKYHEFLIDELKSNSKANTSVLNLLKINKDNIKNPKFLLKGRGFYNDDFERGADVFSLGLFSGTTMIQAINNLTELENEVLRARSLALSGIEK
jgi:hypothetical protein